MNSPLLNETIAEIITPNELIIESNTGTDVIAYMVADRMLLDVEIEPELARFASLAQHRDRFALGVQSVLDRLSYSVGSTKAKVSAPADRVGSSVLHYITADRDPTITKITVRSVISDAKGGSNARHP